MPTPWALSELKTTPGSSLGCAEGPPKNIFPIFPCRFPNFGWMSHWENGRQIIDSANPSGPLPFLVVSTSLEAIGIASLSDKPNVAKSSNTLNWIVYIHGKKEQTHLKHVQ